MQKFLPGLSVLVVAMVCSAAAQAATPAIATADVNLRAGPGTGYPVVRVVPYRAAITSFGCVTDYSWCDIGYAGARGWVASRYVAFREGGAQVVLTPAVAVRYHVPVVTYGAAYWDRHYVGYGWYARGPAYYGRPVAAPCRLGCTVERSGTGPRGNSWHREVTVHR